MVSLQKTEGSSVKTSVPLSLFPVLPYMSQIEVLTAGIKNIVTEQESNLLMLFNTMIMNFRESNYSEIFSNEYKIEKTKNSYYEKSSIAVVHLNCSADEIFIKDSFPVLKFIKKKLESPHLTWVYTITSDFTLVFSTAYGQFLSWSILLKSHSIELISLSLMNPKLLDLIDDDYRTRTYKNSLLTIKQLYTAINAGIVSENLDEVQFQFLHDLLRLTGFETSHKYFTSNFERLLHHSHNYSSIKELKEILIKLENQSNFEIIDKVNIINLLDISPVNLLEITPFIMNEKMRGQFYTPLELAIPLIINSFNHKTPITNYSKLKILDPACGTGILLVVVVEYVVNKLLSISNNKSLLNMRKSVYHANITGLEIDEGLVHYCKSFFALFIKKMSIINESDSPIENNNFLKDFLHKYTKNASTLQKYDFIFSNPPYIPLHSRFMKKVLSDALKNELQQIIPDFMGKRDNLYIMFFGIALEYLTIPNHGTVSFILDSSFLDLPSYKLIRKYLLSKHKLQYILSQYKYGRAVVDLSILIFENSIDKGKTFFWQDNISQSPVERQIADLLDQPNFSYGNQFNPKINKLIRSIQDRSILLENICSISCGLEYGSMLKTHFLSPVKKPDYFKVIDGANGLPQSYVQFWVPNWRNSYVRVSREFEDHLKENQLNRSSKANKEVLLISGNIDRFIKPKIMIRQTASQFIVTYDEKGYFGLRNLHIIHSFDQHYSPLLLLGILSSKLGTTLGKELNIIRGSTGSTNRYPQIRIGDLKRFPIIDLSKCTNFQLENMRKLEEIVSKNLDDGKVVADIYSNIWNKFFEVKGNFPVSSQKRFFQLLDSSKRLSFISKDLLDEIRPILQELRKQKQSLIENQKKIDELVTKIYKLTKKDLFELNGEKN